jgi:hypothetical protein
MECQEEGGITGVGSRVKGRIRGNSMGVQVPRKGDRIPTCTQSQRCAREHGPIFHDKSLIVGAFRVKDV